jgi:Transposase DDE domain
MSRRDGLYQWVQEVTTAFPQLSKPQATVLAWYSFGAVLARSCSLTAVALVLATLLARKFNTVCQRLREFYQQAQAKAGAKRGVKRQDLDVRTCFAPLLRWLLRDWPGRQLPLALDATTLGSRFVVLAVAIVYKGSAIPVAWKVLPALAKEAWQPHWLDLLKQFRGVLPPQYTALAFTDRGLWAQWLFEAIRAQGWHPLMRVNATGTFRPQGWYHFRPLKSFAPQLGMGWQGRGTAFSTKASQLECTLLAYWGAGHQEPWLLLTDLPPSRGEAGWYALRAWIEQGFKDLKRGGLQWQNTRMAEPARVERLWLVLAVATLWLLRVGGEAEEADAVGTLPELRLFTGGEPERPRARRCRLVSVCRRGWVVILVALLAHRRLPLGRWCPEPLPELPDLPAPAPANAEGKQVA